MGRKKINPLQAIKDMLTERDFEILEATIKDDFCNYQYHVTNGIGTGDKHGKELLKRLGIINIDDFLKQYQQSELF